MSVCDTISSSYMIGKKKVVSWYSLPTYEFSIYLRKYNFSYITDKYLYGYGCIIHYIYTAKSIPSTKNFCIGSVTTMRFFKLCCWNWLILICKYIQVLIQENMFLYFFYVFFFVMPQSANQDWLPLNVLTQKSLGNYNRRPYSKELGSSITCIINKMDSLSKNSFDKIEEYLSRVELQKRQFPSRIFRHIQNTTVPQLFWV